MIDVHSATAQTLRNLLDAKAEAERTKLETPGLDHADTQLVRGRLEMLRELLKLIAPPVPKDPAPRPPPSRSNPFGNADAGY